jgi:hypothetical protein
MRPFAAALLLLGASCATVIHGRFQSVPVRSSPSGANILVDCDGDRRDAGTTPAKVTLPRASKTCGLTLTKDGYEPERVDFERVRSKATLVNLVPSAYLSIIGGIIGFAVTFDRGPVDPFIGVAAGGYLGWRAPNAIDEKTGAAWKQVPEEVRVTLSPPGKSASPARSPRF